MIATRLIAHKNMLFIDLLNSCRICCLFFSSELKCDMNFAVYVPPQAEKEKVPVLYWLSGDLSTSCGMLIFLFNC